MSSATRAYRKISSWRSFFTGAALLLDEHCLISVRSSGYEERVKRFSFQDIQAVVVSKSRRFGVSRKVIAAALLILIGMLVASQFSPRLTPVSWIVGGGWVFAWLYISMAQSCRCRIYTAVSREELPSVRRPWTAAKMLSELTPLIEAAQGALPDGWKESVAADRPILLHKAATKSDRQAAPAARTESRGGRLTASGVLVASLLLDVVQTSWELQRTQPMPRWIGYLLALIEAAAAVWVLIQNRGIDVSLQRLGAVVLVFIGLSFYGQTGMVFFAQVQSQVRTKRTLQAAEIRSSPAQRTFMKVYIGGCLILAIVGVILTVGGPTPRRQGVLLD